jgi:ligand-binding SRPBCC domain-containing protein
MKGVLPRSFRSGSAMPHFIDSVIVPAAVEVVFTFFRTPSNLPLLAQPEMHLEIVAAPPLLEQGSRIELKARRWGFSHGSTLEVTALEMAKLLIEEQRAGPFRQWQQVYRFDAVGEKSTRLSDEVTFEPPGGLLGLQVATSFVERELTAYYQFRNQRLMELFGEHHSGMSEPKK